VFFGGFGKGFGIAILGVEIMVTFLPIFTHSIRSYPVILIIDCSQTMRWFGCICRVLCQEE
jgi:hypothetical protein